MGRYNWLGGKWKEETEGRIMKRVEMKEES